MFAGHGESDERPAARRLRRRCGRRLRLRPLHRKLAGALVIAALTSPPVAAAGRQQEADAQCTLAGAFATDTRWAPSACESYLVAADVRVEAGVILTIEPGTILRFDAGTRLQVHGTLIARGTEAAPIRFESSRAEPRPGDWAGLELLGPSAHFDRLGAFTGGTVLEHCAIRHAGGGTDGAVVIGGGPPYIAYSVIEDNAGNGVFRRASTVDGGGPVPLRIAHSRIRRNGANGVAANEGGLVLADNDLSANGSRGLYVSAGLVMRLDFEGNVVRFNGAGGLYLDFGFDGVIRDNVITDNHLAGPLNAGIAVASPFLEGLVITNNDLLDNRGPDGQPIDLRNASPRPLVAQLNWWGTTDPARIAGHIVDSGDDRTLGAVTVEPFLSASNGRARPVPQLFLPLLERLR